MPASKRQRRVMKGRRGFLRISSAPQLAECPGAYMAQLGAPRDRDEDREEWAASGRKLHKAIGQWITAGCPESPPAGWTPAEYERATWAVASISAKVAAHGGIKRIQRERVVEIRKGNRLLWRGHVDLSIVANDGSLHLAENKTGWLRVSDPDRNEQMLGYGIGAVDRRPFPRGGLFIHLVQFPLILTAQLTPAWVEEVKADFVRLYDLAKVGGAAMRRPSVTACRFCLAFGIASRCPESVGIKDSIPVRYAPGGAGGNLARWKPDAIGAMLDRLALVSRYTHLFRTAAADLELRQPGSVEGYRMKRDVWRNTIEWNAPRVKLFLDILWRGSRNEAHYFERLAEVLTPAAKKVATAIGVEQCEGDEWIDRLTNIFGQDAIDTRVDRSSLVRIAAFKRKAKVTG